jgi:predicted metal-dependent hydrolase
MAIDSSSESVDPRLDVAIALFNQGDYYACHDLLEAIWMEAETRDKPFYQGILQIAVGLYHLGNQNWQGASTLLGEGVNRLRAFEPHYQGIDVAQLVDLGWAWLMALQQTGKEAVAPVAQALNQAQIQGFSIQSCNTPQEIKITLNDIVIMLPMPYLYHILNPA